MKYIIEIGSDVMIYIISSISISVQAFKSFREGLNTQTHKQQDNLISLF
jgi:hypothetical protein